VISSPSQIYAATRHHNQRREDERRNVYLATKAVLIHKSCFVELGGGRLPPTLVTYFTNGEEELRHVISIDCASAWTQE
jgi:hypothetical protein